MGVRLGLLTFVLVAFTLLGCSRPNPAYCCVTLEECELDELPTCAGGLVCVGHECVEPTDAGDVDGAVADAGPTACALAGGQIVFETDRDGDFEIATMFPDGSGFAPLTDTVWGDRAPRWSPDGTAIAWQPSPSGEAAIWTMRADGTIPVMVGPPPSSAPTWHPVAARLAFLSSGDIFVVSADGSGLSPLTTTADASYPNWSPDGGRIVFSKSAGGSDLNIWSMTDNGADLEQLTSNTQQEVQPAWSPSGTSIAFLRYNGGGGYRYDLWSMTATGANQVFLGATDVYGLRPLAWSPDGTRLAYVVQVDTTSFEVWTMNADGSERTFVAEGSSPRWSPDGSRLVFASDRDGNDELYIAAPDGSGLINITNNPGSDGRPDWASCAP
jgi:dipeptidyl aminopeptidase/acylaminoacyl peptidase